LHVPLRLSLLNSAFSADIAAIKLADPVNPIKKAKKRRRRKIHGKGTTSEFVTVTGTAAVRGHQGIGKARGNGGC
jgi:hypothetical protein